MTLDSDIDAIVRQSEEPVDKISTAACPFCNEWEAEMTSAKHGTTRAFLSDGKIVEPYRTIGKFRRHLGRHMEQLALFALPRYESGGIEDDSSNEDDEDGQSDEENRLVQVELDESSTNLPMKRDLLFRKAELHLLREEMEREKQLMGSEHGERPALSRYIDGLASVEDGMVAYTPLLQSGGKMDETAAHEHHLSQVNLEISLLRLERRETETMDSMLFPRKYLTEINMPLQVPHDIRNWAQLKQFVVANGMPGQTMGLVKTL